MTLAYDEEADTLTSGAVDKNIRVRNATTCELVESREGDSAVRLPDRPSLTYDCIVVRSRSYLCRT